MRPRWADLQDNSDEEKEVGAPKAIWMKLPNVFNIQKEVDRNGSDHYVDTVFTPLECVATFSAL